MKRIRHSRGQETPAQDGKDALCLDHPLRVLPEHLGERVEKITVRQLLTHRSGYRFGYVSSPRVENTRRLLETDVPNPPGDSMRYSNLNYSLARAVLESLTGQEYPDFVRGRRPQAATDAHRRPPARCGRSNRSNRESRCASFHDTRGNDKRRCDEEQRVDAVQDSPVARNQR